MMATKKTDPKKQKIVAKVANKNRVPKGRDKQAAKGATAATTNPPPATTTAAAVEGDADRTAPVPPKREGARGKRGRKTATAPQGTNGEEPARAPLAARDPRLPEPGTVLRKIDRSGNLRCECTIDEAGVRYNGTTFRSLSAAAVAAAKDLGVKGAQNGYVFWGLVKPPRQPGQAPLVRLQKSWERYASCARSALAAATADQKPDVLAAIGRHRETALADDGSASS
jgi:hypothetical protein